MWQKINSVAARMSNSGRAHINIAWYLLYLGLPANKNNNRFLTHRHCYGQYVFRWCPRVVSFLDTHDNRNSFGALDIYSDIYRAPKYLSPYTLNQQTCQVTLVPPHLLDRRLEQGLGAEIHFCNLKTSTMHISDHFSSSFSFYLCFTIVGVSGHCTDSSIAPELVAPV